MKTSFKKVFGAAPGDGKAAHPHYQREPGNGEILQTGIAFSHFALLDV
jgi:hypothetical protein